MEVPWSSSLDIILCLFQGVENCLEGGISPEAKLLNKTCENLRYYRLFLHQSSKAIFSRNIFSRNIFHGIDFLHFFMWYNFVVGVFSDKFLLNALSPYNLVFMKSLLINLISKTLMQITKLKVRGSKIKLFSFWSHKVLEVIWVQTLWLSKPQETFFSF